MSHNSPSQYREDPNPEFLLSTTKVRHNKLDTVELQEVGRFLSGLLSGDYDSRNTELANIISEHLHELIRNEHGNGGKVADTYGKSGLLEKIKNGDSFTVGFGSAYDLNIRDIPDNLTIGHRVSLMGGDEYGVKISGGLAQSFHKKDSQKLNFLTESKTVTVTKVKNPNYTPPRNHNIIHAMGNILS